MARTVKRLLIKRLLRAEKLLRWVYEECDLSGQMELDAAIRTFLEEI